MLRIANLTALQGGQPACHCLEHAHTVQATQQHKLSTAAAEAYWVQPLALVTSTLQ
jgi:hypothetical protein